MHTLMKQQDARRHAAITRWKMTFAAIAIGVGYWILDSFLMSQWLHEGSVQDELIFSPGPDDIWMRWSVMAALLVFGLYGDITRTRRRQVENTLRSSAMATAVECKQAEESLRESENKFRLLAENISEGFWLLDPKDYRVLYVSPAYQTVWGRSPESLMEDSRSWLENIHPDDLDRVLAALDRQAVTGEFDEEFRIAWPDGSVRWVWDRGFPVKSESGEVQYVVGVVADVTERKLAEEALQRVREDLEGKAERSLEQGESYGLTFREVTVLYLVAEGKGDKEIAAVLGIRPLTVSKHVSNVLGKMNSKSRTEAGTRALREGLLD